MTQMHIGASGASLSVGAAIRQAWLKWPVMLFGIGFPMLIVLLSPMDLWGGAMLAYFNCLLIGVMCLRWLHGGWLPAAVPTIVLFYMGAAYSLAPLYFAVFDSTATYHTLRESAVPYVRDLAKCQLAFTAMLIPYILVVSLFLRRRSMPVPLVYQVAQPKALAGATTAIVFFVNMLLITNLVVKIGGFIEYLANGLYLYLQGMLFAVGAVLSVLNRHFKMFLLISLGFLALFYFIGNARAYAIVPGFLMALGWFFFSPVSNRKKLAIFLIVIVGIPVLLVIGNVTRAVTGGVGFENIGQRWQILTGRGWEYFTKSDVAGSTAGRLFAIGAHTIVTKTPTRVPYVPFDPFLYAQELVSRLLPGELYHVSYYGTNFQLVRYGIRVTDETAVGITMIGHFWMMGGWLLVMFGGLLLGTLHGLLGVVLQRISNRSAVAALIILAALSPRLLWTMGVDYPMHWRYVVWTVILGLMLYSVYWVLGLDRRVPHWPPATGFDPVGYLQQCSALAQRDRLAYDRYLRDYAAKYPDGYMQYAQMAGEHGFAHLQLPDQQPSQ